MKNCLIIGFIILLTNTLAGQIAIIDDPDGYCYVRSSAEKANNIVTKLNNKQFIYCFKSNNNWLNVDYQGNKELLNGYIYQDRVKFISTFPAIPQISKKQLEIIFSKNDIKVLITITKFNKQTASLTYMKNSDRYISKINGKYIWGTDGNMPKMTYASIIVTIAGQRIMLPINAFNDLFEPNFNNTKVNYDKANDILYISSSNSDGAGGYAVVWKIEKGVYKERFVCHGF